MKAYTKHRIIEGDGTKSKMDIMVDQGTQSLKLEIKSMPFIIGFENIDQFCNELKSLAQENRKSIVVDNARANMEPEEGLMLKTDTTMDTIDKNRILLQQEEIEDESE